MPVIETCDKQLLRSVLARDPIGAIYLLGDLDDLTFSHCRWFVDGERGVLLLYSELAVPAVLPFGDVAAIVGQALLPDRFYTKLSESDRALFRDWRLSDPDELYVMGLTGFRPTDPIPGLKLCRVADGAPLVPLYDDYPGNYFSPVQVPSAYYVAAYFDGRLVAAAGTHAWAPEEGAAAIGNVVTAVPYRGRGIGRAVVGYLCEELLARGCRQIGLHVNRFNRPAINCYRGLGFSIHSEITQWTATRRKAARGRSLKTPPAGKP